jgi:cation transport ATPase
LKEILGVEENEKEFYLKVAASLAKKSRHPISQAIFNAYLGELEELEVKEYQGLGLEARFNGGVIKLGKKEFCGVLQDWHEREGGVANSAQQMIEASFEKGGGQPHSGWSEDLTSLKQHSYQQGGEGYLFCFMKIADREIIFILEDEIKSDAKSVIKQLREMDKKVILLSGDIENNVVAIAQQLEIEEFYFEKTPIEKIEFLEKLKATEKKFIMVGDGLNDAPALSLADVSISFANAVDISQNVSDVIIQNNKLTPIIDLIILSKKSIHLMKQNLLIALVYNLIALPFAIMGYVVPLIAAIAMSSSSLLVLFNSLRINKCRS